VGKRPKAHDDDIDSLWFSYHNSSKLGHRTIWILSAFDARKQQNTNIKPDGTKL